MGWYRRGVGWPPGPWTPAMFLYKSMRRATSPLSYIRYWSANLTFWAVRPLVRWSNSPVRRRAEKRASDRCFKSTRPPLAWGLLSEYGLPEWEPPGILPGSKPRGWPPGPGPPIEPDRTEPAPGPSDCRGLGPAPPGDRSPIRFRMSGMLIRSPAGDAPWDLGCTVLGLPGPEGFLENGVPECPGAPALPAPVGPPSRLRMSSSRGLSLGVRVGPGLEGSLPPPTLGVSVGAVRRGPPESRVSRDGESPCRETFRRLRSVGDWLRSDAFLESGRLGALVGALESEADCMRVGLESGCRRVAGIESPAAARGPRDLASPSRLDLSGADGEEERGWLADLPRDSPRDREAD